MFGKFKKDRIQIFIFIDYGNFINLGESRLERIIKFREQGNYYLFIFNFYFMLNDS